MELAANPSADLLALSGPSAGAWAPMLRPAAGEPTGAAAEAPFDALLAVLWTPLLAGEPLPATGKELPLEPAALDPDEIVTPMAPLMPAPLTLPNAAELRLRAAVSSDVTVPSPLSPAPIPSVAAPAAIPGAELAAFVEMSPPTATSSPVVTIASSLLAAVQPDTPEVASPTTPTWLDELLADSAQRSAPAASVVAEQRAAAAQSATPPPSPAVVAAPPPDVAPQVVKIGRDDAIRAPHVAPLVGDAPSAARIDWLPTSPVHAAAPHAPTAPTVAAPSAPVDAKTPNWHEAFAGRVQWLVDNQVGEARIKLNPPELGAIDVKISHVDEKSYVQLTAASPAARDELANGLNRLRELFSTSGLTLGGASVESGSAGYHDAHAERADSRWAPERPLTATFADTEAVPRARAAGRIDIFA